MNPLEQLQSDILYFLLAHESLQHVGITQVRPRTASEAAGIITKLNQGLAGLLGRNGKQGVSVMIMMPEIGGLEGNVRALVGDLRISIDVVENILVNMGPDGTGKSAETHALEIAALLQHQSMKPWGPIVGQPQLITPLPEAVMDAKVMYRIHLQTNLTTPNKPKVQTPKITVDAGVVTLSGSTPGAAVYYTLDGSYPSSANEAAVLYDAPFSVASGSTPVRVAGYLAGSAGSHVMAQTVVVE